MSKIKMVKLMLLCLFISLCSPQILWAIQIATHSFTNLPGRGTYPLSLQIHYRNLKVDLSPLRGAKHIYRAHLFINVNPYWSERFNKVPEKKFCLVTNIYPNKCLSTAPPRHIYFDLTEDLKEALRRGNSYLEVTMKEAPAYGFGNPPWRKDQNGNVLIHLDVTCDLPLPEGAPRAEIPIFTTVYSREGDTLLLWQDPEPLTTEENITVEEFKSLLKKAEGPPHQVRFRIYRSQHPITPESVSQAELLDEVGPLTVWDEEFLGQWWLKEKKLVPRMPFEDEKIARPDENIYVYHNRENGRYYYAVVKVLDGQEDLTQLILGKNSLATPVIETPGPGLVLLRKKEKREKFYYVDGPIEMNFFVRWEAPPRANFPSTPFNYLVARSLNPKHQPKDGKHPVNINLHCWGGSLLSGFLWWYEAEKGSLLLTTNQRPYDWWTGYNEARGTYLSYSDHPVRNYTQKRIESFLKDFVFKRWPVDKNRFILSGGSMGGSGTIMWGVRRPDLFAYLKGEVGVYIPAESPTFTNSFYSIYGHPSWPVKYEGTDLSPYEYWDTKRWLYENPSLEIPFTIFANGRNDNSIGWPQAWKVAKAFQKTKRPFVFRWAMEGHGTRSLFPGGGDRWPTLLISKNQSLPAFTNCSLDTPLGNSPDEAPDKGQINYYLLWKSEDIIDEANRWEITVYLSEKAPQEVATVDITPRRLQLFEVEQNKIYYWENIRLKDKKIIQQGLTKPDHNNLLTIPHFEVSKIGNKLMLRPATQEEIEKFQENRDQNDESSNRSDSKEENVQKEEYISEEANTALPSFDEIPADKKKVISFVQADKLPDIVNQIQEGTTIFLKDGLYKIPRTIWIKKRGIAIRSLSGNPNRVILSGDYKVGEIINIQASNVTIADITIKKALYHAIHLAGGAHHVRLINLHLLDCGEQLIKVNPSRTGESNDYGLLAKSLLEFTDSGRKKIRDSLGGGSCYTNGIDILKAQGWRIVENTFYNIYCEPGRTLPQAILVWQGSRDTVVERNRIVNCPIGIQLGLGSSNRRRYEDLDYTASHIGGIVRNNFIFADRDHAFDTGIGLWAAKGTLVINNTIYSEKTKSFASIDLRFSETQATVWNNLIFKAPLFRDGASADLKANLIAQETLFLDPRAGDLHLKEAWPEVVNRGEPHPAVKFDIDGEKRDELPDIGADEWSGLLLEFDPAGKYYFSAEEPLLLWSIISPESKYKEFFLWADTPNGRFCYSLQGWSHCDQLIVSAQRAKGKYLVFDGFLSTGVYKVYLAGDESLDGILEKAVNPYRVIILK